MDCTNIIGEKIKSLRTNQEISIPKIRNYHQIHD